MHPQNLTDLDLWVCGDLSGFCLAQGDEETPDPDFDAAKIFFLTLQGQKLGRPFSTITIRLHCGETSWCNAPPAGVLHSPTLVIGVVRVNRILAGIGMGIDCSEVTFLQLVHLL
jgi:hypothetical protein